MEKYPGYAAIFAKLSFGESQMLDKAFFEEEVKRLMLSYDQQVCTLCHALPAEPPPPCLPAPVVQGWVCPSIKAPWVQHLACRVVSQLWWALL